MGGHNSYTLDGTIVNHVVDTLAPVMYVELKSTKHALNAIIHDNQNDSQRGCIDVSGNSSGDFDVNTVLGGEFDFRKATVIAPNKTGAVISIRNRGATGIEYTCNLDGFQYDAPNASVLLSGKTVSGDKMKNVKFNVGDTIWEGGLSIDAETELIGIEFRGKESVSLTTSDFLVQEPVVFSKNLPRVPEIQISRRGSYSGLGTFPIIAYTSESTSGFTINVATADGAKFASNSTSQVSWEAKVR